VARTGAGLALDDGERRTRGVLELPDATVMAALAPAVRRVLDDPGHRREATRMAAAMRALAPVDAAVATLAAIGAGSPA
jgi:hypothetical protein